MLEDRLENYGCDVRGAVQRVLGRAEIYESLVHSFLEDSSYLTAKKAREDNDAEGYFHAIHTLKGTSGNLGFTKLFGAASDICLEYKAGNVNGAFAKFDSLSELYDELCSIIKGNN